MRRYHWILTLQHSSPHGMGIAYERGIVTPHQKQTREQVFEDQLQYVCGKHGIHPAHAVVTFWSLEPDELS